jgi:hypothetical protein
MVGSQGRREWSEEWGKEYVGVAGVGGISDEEGDQYWE